MDRRDSPAARVARRVDGGFVVRHAYFEEIRAVASPLVADFLTNP